MARITFECPDRLKQLMKDEAEADRRSLSVWLVQTLENYFPSKLLDKKGKKS